jgi:hypothetical protein
MLLIVLCLRGLQTAAISTALFARSLATLSSSSLLISLLDFTLHNESSRNLAKLANGSWEEARRPADD